MAGKEKEIPCHADSFSSCEKCHAIAVAWHGRQNLSLSHDRRWRNYVTIASPFLSTTKNRKGLFL